MWCFQAVTACYRHRRILKQICPWCNRQSYPLASNAQAGFCFLCKRWLGETANKKKSPEESLADDEFEWQAWVTAMIGELLAAAPSLDGKLFRESISNSIDICVERVAGGKPADPARMLKIASSTITYWRRNSCPQLSSLLRVCFQSKVSLLSFLTGTILPKDITDKSSQQSVTVLSSASRRPRNRYTVMDRVQAEVILRDALKEFPPPSLEQVLIRMGRRTWPASKYFPRLSKAVINRYAAYLERQKSQIRRTRKRALKTALKSKKYPSPTEVARELCCSHHTLKKMFPDLYRSLSKRHVEGREKRWLEVGNTLRAVLEESPPISRYEIARRTGFSYERIRARFPELYRDIAARYLKFLYKRKRLNC
jgi:hypothetical protein